MGFQTGAFFLAARPGLPVAPLVMRGNRTLFGPEQPLPRRSALSVQFLPALRADGNDRAAVDRLRDTARASMLAHCGEADGLRTTPVTT